MRQLWVPVEGEAIFYVLTDDGKTCRVGVARTSAQNVAKRLQPGNPRALVVVLETEVVDVQMLVDSTLAWFRTAVLPTGWLGVSADDVVAFARRELSIHAARYGDRLERGAVMIADSDFRHALRKRALGVSK